MAETNTIIIFILMQTESGKNGQGKENNKAEISVDRKQSDYG